MAYVYRLENIDRLTALTDAALHFERHFGPPADFPHEVLETVRKQLPTTRAVYKMECWRKPLSSDLARKGTVLLRIPERNELFADMMRVPDERLPLQRVVYFGVDDAVRPTNRHSPQLFLPFSKVDVLVAGKWMPLSFSAIVALADLEETFAAELAA